jgi:hypothetical protein
MTMDYYELTDDIYFPNRWYLKEVIEVEDNWLFIYGKKLNKKDLPNKLTIRLYQDGDPMDYTIVESYGIPVISQRIKEQLDDLMEIQFLPVNIENKEVSLKYYIMVVTNTINCVNEELSLFGKFKENDPVRPDLAGHYSWFSKLIIDPTKTNHSDIFRLEMAVTDLIVSQRVKDVLNKINATGIKLTKVTI